MSEFDLVTQDPEEELKEGSSDFDYIENIIDGMESIAFGDDEHSVYNRALVMGIAENHGIRTDMVEGTEGFVDWFKETCEKVWKSIKAFFKGMWEAIFGPRKKQRNYLEETEEALKAMRQRNMRFQSNLAATFEASRQRMREGSEALDKVLKDIADGAKSGSNNSKYESVTLDDIVRDARNFATKMANEANGIEEDFSCPDDLDSWLKRRKESKKRVGRMYDLAEDQWKVLDRQTDEIKRLTNGISDNMPKEEQDKKRKELQELKLRLNHFGKLVVVTSNFAKKADNAIEKESKAVLALTHKKAA